MPSAAEGTRWRVLVALLVYNGEEFVGPCLESMARIDPGRHAVDLLVLDDASPAPGWSGRCRALAEGLGIGYYCSPRNLGIPRNMNLALLRAVDAGYDAVVLLNSDTVVPRNLVTTLVQPLIEDDGISSTTAWSNNVSIYSLPTRRGDLLATDESLLNWVSDALEEEFGQQTIDVPSAVGFCMAIPTAVIRQVGIMDPAFGRGYSEEIDWCLRSHAAGFRSVLCPSCFVYHAGSGVTRAEGMIEGVDNLVDAHQAIIDERYPLYRSQVTAWLASSIPNGLRERGLQHLLVTASRQLGSRVDATQSTIDAEDDLVCFGIDPSQPAWVLVASFKGFSMNFPVGEGGVLATVEAITGRPPSSVRIDRRGPISTELRRSLDQRADIVLECPPYMAHVF